MLIVEIVKLVRTVANTLSSCCPGCANSAQTPLPPPLCDPSIGRYLPSGALRSPPRAGVGVCSEWLLLDCHLMIWAFMQQLVATLEWLSGMSPTVR